MSIQTDHEYVYYEIMHRFQVFTPKPDIFIIFSMNFLKFSHTNSK